MSAKNVAEKIAQELTEFQDMLVELVQSGRTDEQSIEPTVTIQLEELKRMAGRVRKSDNLIEDFVYHLKQAGLEVQRAIGDEFVITKRAESLRTEFSSYLAFTRYLNAVRRDQEANAA